MSTVKLILCLISSTLGDEEEPTGAGTLADLKAVTVNPTANISKFELAIEDEATELS